MPRLIHVHAIFSHSENTVKLLLPKHTSLERGRSALLRVLHSTARAHLSTKECSLRLWWCIPNLELWNPTQTPFHSMGKSGGEESSQGIFLGTWRSRRWLGTVGMDLTKANHAWTLANLFGDPTSSNNIALPTPIANQPLLLLKYNTWSSYSLFFYYWVKQWSMDFAFSVLNSWMVIFFHLIQTALKKIK